uniref:Uncharacterized protein n=1 Tax=Nelumbo nucifera TaxID=4432 RepID=A0A822ZY14_NELNU|nr:TPA_asm: hypothetical protein HUJ06_018358 [Nelumbo nucifera]
MRALFGRWWFFTLHLLVTWHAVVMDDDDDNAKCVSEFLVGTTVGDMKEDEEEGSVVVFLVSLCGLWIVDCGLWIVEWNPSEAYSFGMSYFQPI